MAFAIRPARRGDADVIFDIRTSVEQNHQSRDELEAKGITPAAVGDMLEGDCPGWIAEEHGLPVAFAMADDVEGCVFAMFVRPGHEGRGLGRLLMREAETFLFGRHERIWLNTGTGEAIRANGFYRRLGWTAAGPAEGGQTRYEKARPQLLEE